MVKWGKPGALGASMRKKLSSQNTFLIHNILKIIPHWFNFNERVWSVNANVLFVSYTAKFPSVVPRHARQVKLKIFLYNHLMQH